MSAVPARQRHRAAASLPASPDPGRAAPRPGLRVVPGGSQGRRTATPGKRPSRASSLFRSHPVRCTVAMLVVSAVVFGLVLLNIHVAQTSFRLSDLQQRAAELQTEQRRLRYEVAKAESPEKVVEMSASLGLIAPSGQQYIEGPSLLVGDRAGDETEPAGEGESSR